MSDFNSLVQYTVENISRPIKYIIYKLTEFIRVVDKFVFRQVPADAASGYATIEKIEGNTVAWNQIVPVPTMQVNYTWPSTTTTYYKNYTLSDAEKITLLSYHKYYIKISVDNGISGDNGFSIQFFSGNSIITNCTQSGTNIVTSPSTAICNIIRINNYSFKRGFSAGDYINLTFFKFIDLTRLGIDNLTTTAEVESWLAQHIGTLPYYDYNTGELLSVKMSGMQTQDANSQTLDTIALDVTTITGINPNTNTREVMFADGMKQADRDGNVKDTLDLRSDTATVNVGSRAYQSGDESDTSVITDGTTTYYALTTPIEYTDLQDANGNPLNPRYKVEQGGTEQVLPVNTSSPTTVAPTLTTTYTKDNN